MKYILEQNVHTFGFKITSQCGQVLFDSDSTQTFEQYCPNLDHL